MKRLHLCHTFGHGRFGKDISGVLSQIALLAQMIEPTDRTRIDTECH